MSIEDQRSPQPSGAHKSGMARLLWTYGPTFRWRHFRLYGHYPNGKWMPIRLTQVIGGRNWSLSLCRTGRVREDR